MSAPGFEEWWAANSSELPGADPCSQHPDLFVEGCLECPRQLAEETRLAARAAWDASRGRDALLAVPDAILKACVRRESGLALLESLVKELLEQLRLRDNLVSHLEVELKVFREPSTGGKTE